MQSYGLELTDTIVDAGESAKSLDRPWLQRALGMLKAGDAEALLVLKLDRLTRSVVDLGTLVDRYVAPGSPRCSALANRSTVMPVTPSAFESFIERYHDKLSFFSRRLTRRGMRPGFSASASSRESFHPRSRGGQTGNARGLRRNSWHCGNSRLRC
jgi:resolvase-like protein